MRFGHILSTSIYKPWKDKYIDYDKLKKLLREDEVQGSGDDDWTERDEENFVHELVTVQLDKVREHQVTTSNSLRDRTTACEAKLQPTSITSEDVGPSSKEEDKKEIAQEVQNELDKISAEITELKKFSRINYTGFLKAAKKHDRRRGHLYRVRPVLLVRLSETPFNSEDYSPLLYRLSTMYSWTRQILEGEDTTKRVSHASIRPKDTYIAHKFWVHADNLLEVKTFILRRLPVLIYNPQSLKIVDSSQKDPTLTSIYFDSPKFDLYTQKVNNEEATHTLRLRWTGMLNDKPEILLEKKTVSNSSASKDIRIRIKDKYIEPFLKGEYKMEKQIQKLEAQHGVDSEQANTLKSNVEEIQSFIKEQKLQPVLRASYTRTAFQIPGDDRIRVSLDTDLALIREDALDPNRPCRDPEEWHRSDIDLNELEYPYLSIKKGEISRFEHGILEIKVKDSKYTRNNTWLADLMSTHLVKEAPKFSKFVHGVASLFEDYVNTMPFWMSDLDTDIRRDPDIAFKEEQDKLAKKAEDEFAVGSFMPTVPSSFRAKVGSPAKFPRDSKTATILQSKRSPPITGVEEHDSGEDGGQGTDAQVGATDFFGQGLRSLFPAFSNSRYARRQRGANPWQNAPLPPGVKDPGKWIKDQGTLKVEAKVWLANQRTFIKWQHIAVLLASLSLGLYNAAGIDNNIARTLALIYTLFAVFAGCWGWGMYLWRSKLITERSGKDFDNMVGPFVVSIGLACALLLNFAFKYTTAMAEREGQGGNKAILNSSVWQQELR
jgi:SPX domain protein involved in polyphosphate accumulation